MKKLLAVGSLLLTSAGVMTTPAAARDFSDYRYPAYSYQSRSERERAERLRLERLRRERERERREWLMRHRAWDRW